MNREELAVLGALAVGIVTDALAFGVAAAAAGVEPLNATLMSLIVYGGGESVQRARGRRVRQVGDTRGADRVARERAPHPAGARDATDHDSDAAEAPHGGTSAGGPVDRPRHPCRSPRSCRRPQRAPSMRFEAGTILPMTARTSFLRLLSLSLAR